MNIDVRLIPNAISEKDVRDRVVVVIDVLRSCSTIATAFANGAREVIPSPDMATASRIAANMDADRFRLGGEKEGRKIDGYHLGNSPLEYTADEVENRTIVFKSTNGTDAILMGTAAKHLVTASLLNAGRVVDFIREQNEETLLICAGQRGSVTLEDTICAGLILSRLWNGDEPADCSDTAHLAHQVFRRDEKRIVEALTSSQAAASIAEMGYPEDAAYCAQVDLHPVLPMLLDNRLTSV